MFYIAMGRHDPCMWVITFTNHWCCLCTHYKRSECIGTRSESTSQCISKILSSGAMRKTMAGAVNNVASVRRVLVGLGAHDARGKPKIADFSTCLVHHFSPNGKSTTINCKVQDDLLLLYSQNEKNKLSDENKPSTGTVNDQLGCVTLYVCPEFDEKP